MTCQDRGFNTGVILLDLARLRQLDWVHMWKSVASRELTSLQFTVLADQVCFSLSAANFLSTSMLVYIHESNLRSCGYPWILLGICCVILK